MELSALLFVWLPVRGLCLWVECNKLRLLLSGVNDAYETIYRVTPNPPSNAMRPVITTKAVRAFAIAIIVLLVGKKRPLF